MNSLQSLAFLVGRDGKESFCAGGSLEGGAFGKSD